jgi:type IV secretion system protein VirD4
MGKGTLRPMAFEAWRAKYMWPKKTGGIGAGAAGITATVAALMHNPDVAAAAAGGGGAWVLGATAVWSSRHVLLPGSSEAWAKRRKTRSEQHGGMASRSDIWEKASVGAMKRDVGTYRPSLRCLSRRERRQLKMKEVAQLVGTLGLGWAPWHKVWSPWEDTTGIEGAPRSGKTAALAVRAYYAPGTLITTSTRKDIAEWVYDQRTKDGRAFHVWNPTAYVKIESTSRWIVGGETLTMPLRWAVLTGCKDYATATDRATDLIPPGGEDASPDHATWLESARPLLGLMMWAAANSGRRMRDVLRWSADQPKGTSTECAARAEIEEVITRVGGDDAEVRMYMLKEHYSKGDKTRASVTHTMQKALFWLQHEKACMLGDSPVEDNTLNIRKLHEEHETLCIFGHEKQEVLAPLNRCLMGEIAHQQRILAGDYLEERIDPPVTECLDEVGLVCKVPLEQWLPDMGGRGVNITYCVQSKSQLRQKYGRDTASSILGATNTYIVFGGGNGAEDLAETATLGGKARYKNAGEKQDAADSHRIEDVMSAGEIRANEKGTAYVFRTGLRTLLLRMPRVWEIDGIKRVNLSLPNMPVIPAAIAAMPEQATAEEVSS